MHEQFESEIRRIRKLAGIKEEDVIHNGKVVDRQAEREHRKEVAKLPKIEDLKEKDAGAGTGER